MPIPELILGERDGTYLLLDATNLPMLHGPPTNRRNCRDLHRRGNPRFVARVLGVAVQHRVPLPARNYVQVGPESDAVLHRVYGGKAETAFVGNTAPNWYQKVQAVF